MRSPQWCNGRAVEQHVGVGAVDVPVLQLRGGRRHMVGGSAVSVLKCSSTTVKSPASKTLHHFARLRAPPPRVAVVDHQRLNAGQARHRPGSKSLPMVDILMLRGLRPANKSGRCKAAFCTGKLPELDSSTARLVTPRP